jgi:hypothetical protein
MSSARINDDKFVLDHHAFEAAVLRDDVHNCFGKIIEDRRARSDRAGEIDVIDTADIPADNHSAEFGLLIRRQFGGRGGPLLHCARAARAMLFSLGGGPALGGALHWAGLVSSARLLLRRTLGGQVRGNRRAFSHVGRSFGGELPNG